MKFAEVIEGLKLGNAYRRSGWHDGLHIVVKDYEVVVRDGYGSNNVVLDWDCCTKDDWEVFANLSFLEALCAMERGKEVRRAAWLKGKMLSLHNESFCWHGCNGMGMLYYQDVSANDWMVV